MFVAWQRKALGEKGILREHDTCAHAPFGPNRVSLTPAVRHSVRVNGKPRSEVIYRPATSIRPCCLKGDDPIARWEFWRTFDRKLVELSKDASNPHRAHLLAESQWLRRELAKVVPPLGSHEHDLAECYIWPGCGFRGFTEAIDFRREGLLEAKKRRAEYQHERRDGETVRQWEERMRPPPKWRRVHVNPNDFGAANSTPPPSRQPMCFSTLGLQWPCTAAQTKAAFRALAAKHHPDRGGQAAAFIAVEKAYREALEFIELSA